MTDVEDYPRVCGEEVSPCQVSSIDSGSPPHARGRGEMLEYEAENEGITPARAGKSIRGTIRDFIK